MAEAPFDIVPVVGSFICEDCYEPQEDRAIKWGDEMLCSFCGLKRVMLDPHGQALLHKFFTQGEFDA